jgi:hypothetical protein
MVRKKGADSAHQRERRKDAMTLELRCPYCTYSKRVPKEKIPAGAKWATCPRCHQRFELSFFEKRHPFTEKSAPETGLDTSGQGDQGVRTRSGAPWEKRSELGLWQAIYQTFKTVLFSPEALFRALTFRGGITEPLAFGVLVGSVGTMFGLFWQFLVWSGFMLFSMEPIFGQLTFGLIYLSILVVTPIFWILWIFFSGTVIHLLLLVVRGGQNGYEGTLRVVSYSQAAQIWSLIPFAGGLVGWIWQLVIQIIGLRQVHETSYARVIIALLIPVAVILLLLILVVVGLVLFFR